MSCRRSQGYLEKRGISIDEIVEAKKHRFGEVEVLSLVRKMNGVVVSRGKRVTEFSTKPNILSEKDLLKGMLGPTGNLRAPTMVIDRVIYVGFHEETLERALRR